MSEEGEHLKGEPTRSSFTLEPIKSAEEDLLDRVGFSKLLARALAEYPQQSSLVVALYGDWGAGKSSALNLCFKELEEREVEDRPLVVRFNPWWYSNTGELLMRFFEQLGEEIGQRVDKGNEEAGRSIEQKLSRYGRLLTPLGGLVDLAGGAGAGTVIARILEQGIQTVLSDADEGTAADVRDLRDDISQILVEYGRPVIVAIDDIDRLSGEEIRDVFKLVKATANFSNTRYLLAFDKETVVDALRDVQGPRGEAYLEKIVQISFRLPQPTQGQLVGLLTQGIEEILDRQENLSEEEMREAKERLDGLTYSGFGELWKNMRQVNRFLNSFSFVLPPVAGEVNLADFLSLEALRIAVPEVYEKIVRGYELLAASTPEEDSPLRNLPASEDRSPEVDEATKTEVDAICEAAPEPARSMVRELLEELFPRVRDAMHGTDDRYGPTFRDEQIVKQAWIGEKRVCMPEFFRVATSWSLSPSIIPSAEAEQLVGIEDSDELREALLAYRKDLRPGITLKTAINRVGDWYRSSHNVPSAATLLRAVIGIESFGDDYTSVCLLGSDMLRRVPDSVSRKQAILEEVRANGVAPVLVEIMMEQVIPNQEEYGDRTSTISERSELYKLLKSYTLLRPDDFREVGRAIINDIARQAKEGSLLDREHFDLYLYLWKHLCKDLEGPDRSTEYVRELISDDQSLVEFLKAYATKSSKRIFAGDSERVESPSSSNKLAVLDILGIEFNVVLLTDFQLLEEAKHRANQLYDSSPDWLKPDAQDLLWAFNSAYKG